jgi:anaerobic magnesium-protoporphyrin IX monomethyl ester cyclase
MANVLLISYDNGSHKPMFPQNIFHLMGALRKKDHKVGVWFQDVHHEPDAKLSELMDSQFFDVIGIGFVAGYYPYQKIKSLSNVINTHKHRELVTYVLGGHGPAGAPEFFLERMGADVVVVGEGEDAICDIAENEVKGVVYGENSKDDFPALDSYAFFPMDVYRLNRCPTSKKTDFVMSMLTSKGCKWKCSFCYRMREGFHEREIEAIEEEILYLNQFFSINHFDFEDELLMSSVKRTGEICEMILSLPFRIKWDCNGRLNYAKSDILRLMKTAGCEYVNYGIESLNQNILNQMGKGLKVSTIYQGVEDSLKEGLSPGLNLLWGFPENTEQDLFDQVAFLKKYDPCDELRTIRPVTAYPGCRLFNEAVDKGLVEDAEDFYENKHLNSDLISTNFMDYTDEKAHEMLYWANTDLITNYYHKKLDISLESAKDLYLNYDTKFRGFRNV